ncbi:uncharacterized protein LOC125944587 [Dermacentor silvarum]|uniref:uncharacterized protein LOC125944587 n=1 Tax=Dermacentor silvarum TaxID=543639 RepID=UPI002100A7A9|nr:uncharacterized protein LOC125944587 [Dermacentor silvarum]
MPTRAVLPAALWSLLDRGGFTWPYRGDVADAGALFAQLLAASNRVGLPALVSVETSPLRLAPSTLLGEHRLRLKFMGRWRFRDYYRLLASMLARPSVRLWSDRRTGVPLRLRLRCFQHE